MGNLIIVKLEHSFILKSKHSLLFSNRYRGYHKGMLNINYEKKQKEELSARVNEAISSMGRGGKSSIAKELNISPTAITGWIKTGRISKESIEIVSRMSGYSLNWLITGKGEKLSNAQNSLPLSSQPDNNKAGRRIPLIELQQAGLWEEAIKNHTPGIGDIMINHQVGKNAFAITIDSDSMEPRFLEGDVILIDPDLPHQHKKFVVARIDGDYVLRQYWQEAGKTKLKPLNRRYDDDNVDDCEIIGVGFKRYVIEDI